MITLNQIFGGSPGESSAMVKCATCGQLATHQNRVDVYCREQDAERGRHVVVDATKGDPPARPDWGENGAPLVFTNDDMGGNPSRRRHGLTVTLWGECGHMTLLHVYQHKGVTYVETVVAP